MGKTEPLPQPCAVCGQVSLGLHFGAVTCRACAAFFRRSLNSKRTKECRQGTNKCEIVLENGFYNCKKCRLQKCLAVGMDAAHCLSERNAVNSRAIQVLRQSITPTMSTFLGRPNLIIFNVRNEESSSKPGKFIDVKFLIDKALLVLSEGVASPIHSKTTLDKLAFALENVRYSTDELAIQSCSKLGRNETFVIWENHFLKLANWLNYFDAFRQLPKCLQIKMATSMWCVWNQMICLAKGARQIRSMFSEEEIRKLPKDYVIYDWSHIELDMSWCSSYPTEQIKFFVDINCQLKMDDLTRMMIELNPTDVELSYMLCHLCFQNVVRKNDELREIVEGFQESLANDLHRYYVEEMNVPRYSSRLAGMMKINNRIQEGIRKNREKIELAIMFEIMNCECSHPEMFLNA